MTRWLGTRRRPPPPSRPGTPAGDRVHPAPAPRPPEAAALPQADAHRDGDRPRDRGRHRPRGADLRIPGLLHPLRLDGADTAGRRSHPRRQVRFQFPLDRPERHRRVPHAPRGASRSATEDGDLVKRRRSQPAVSGSGRRATRSWSDPNSTKSARATESYSATREEHAARPADRPVRGAKKRLLRPRRNRHGLLRQPGVGTPCRARTSSGARRRGRLARLAPRTHHLLGRARPGALGLPGTGLVD